MDTSITSRKEDREGRVWIQIGEHEKLYRRVWAGAVPPSFKPGHIVVVGEVDPQDEPEDEPERWGTLVVLDEAPGDGIDDLIRNAATLEDLYGINCFFTDESKDVFMRKLRGHIYTRVSSASYVNDFETGYHIIMSLQKRGKLKYRKHIIESFPRIREEDSPKVGDFPIFDALRFVLTEFDERPYTKPFKGFTNWSNKAKEERRSERQSEGSFREIYIK